MEEHINYFDTSFVLDRKLYKYFGNVDNAVKAIRKRGIHLDDPDSYNDPFDLKSAIDIGGETYFKNLKCKSSCFSELENSVVMWSYYGNKGKGICLEYDFSKLPNDIYNQKIVDHIIPVHYSNIRADRIGNNLRLMESINFALSKSEEWQHEREWRYICRSTESDYLKVDCITKIFLGYDYDKTSKGYTDLLKAAKNYDELVIYECFLDKNEYKILSQEILSSADKDSIEYEINKYETYIKNKNGK